MFLSQLRNVDKDKMILAKSLYIGLDFISQADFSGLPDGKHDIGEGAYVSISTYATQPVEERRPESHHKYIDLQFIIEGEEQIGYTDIAQAGEIAEENTVKDLVFYKSVDNETMLKMLPGSFAVFYPWDVHRPNCLAKSSVRVRKAVVKIPVSR